MLFGIINNLVNQAIAGRFNNHPLMAQYKKMMDGKTDQEKLQTLMNIAKEKGWDLTSIRFTEDQARKIGLIK